MERERLTRLVQEPGKVAREDLAGLKALTEKYPWFSGAQLLRSAGERRSADVLFDETLRTASAHLPSRAALFDLGALPEQPPAPLQVVRTEPAPTEHIPSPPVAIVTKGPAEEPPTPEPVAVVAPTPIAPPPALSEKEALMEELAPLVESAPPESPALTAELDRQIMEAAMASAYDLTWSEPVAAPPKPSNAPAPPPPTAAPEPPPAPRPRLVAANARMRFTEWLDLVDEPAAPSVQPPAEDTISPPPVPPAVIDSPALPPMELIDRFIRQETPEPKPTATFFTPQHAGKRSLDDTAGLVTETLARVYEKQGNLAKAIDTYRRLALKYPEKAAYFAALQKSLEDQQIK